MEKIQEINSISLNIISEYIKAYNSMLDDFSVKIHKLKDIICEYHSKHRCEYVEYFPNTFCLRFNVTIDGLAFNVIIWDFKTDTCHMNLLCPIIEDDGSITINTQISNHFMSKKFIPMLDKNYRSKLKGIALESFVNLFDDGEQKRILNAFKADVEDIKIFYGEILDDVNKYSFVKLRDEYITDVDKTTTICLMFVLYYKEREEYVRKQCVFDYFDVEE